MIDFVDAYYVYEWLIKRPRLYLSVACLDLGVAFCLLLLQSEKAAFAY